MEYNKKIMNENTFSNLSYENTLNLISESDFVKNFAICTLTNIINKTSQSNFKICLFKRELCEIVFTTTIP